VVVALADVITRPAYIGGEIDALPQPQGDLIDGRPERFRRAEVREREEEEVLHSSTWSWVKAGESASLEHYHNAVSAAGVSGMSPGYPVWPTAGL
jgi:hypothetical protein